MQPDGERITHCLLFFKSTAASFNSVGDRVQSTSLNKDSSVPSPATAFLINCASISAGGVHIYTNSKSEMRRQRTARSTFKKLPPHSDLQHSKTSLKNHGDLRSAMNSLL